MAILLPAKYSAKTFSHDSMGDYCVEVFVFFAVVVVVVVDIVTVVVLV